MKVCFDLQAVADLLIESKPFQGLVGNRPFTLDFDIRDDGMGDTKCVGLEVTAESPAKKGDEQ